MIDIDTVPVDNYLDTECRPQEKWRHVLSGGDDYELCFTVPPDRQQDLQRIGAPVYRIGTVTAEQGLRCMRAPMVPNMSARTARGTCISDET